MTNLPERMDDRDPTEAPVSIPEKRQFAAMCKALGHPVRLRILEHLKNIDSCICGDIVETLPLAQSTVSQHLKVLKSAGFIQGEVNGPKTCYCLDPEAAARFNSWATDFFETWTRRSTG